MNRTLLPITLLALASAGLAGCKSTGCGQHGGPTASLYSPCDGTGSSSGWRPSERLRTSKECCPTPLVPGPDYSRVPPPTPAIPYRGGTAPDLHGYGPLPRGSSTEPPQASPNGPAPVKPWQPEPGPIVRLSVPEALAPDSSRDTAKVEKPQSPEPPASPKTEGEERGGTPSLPVGIPRFAWVKDERIACGLKPHPLDGLSWLKAHGYRTVVHIRQPGEIDPADQRVIEKSGLKYVALDVSVTTLNREQAEQFARLVGQAGNQPVFVYDRDGLMAGALWYLYFRGAENLPEDQARSRAGRLGLKDDGSDEARALWAAVQKVTQ